MKYRILERNDGTFIVQYKKGLFHDWFDLSNFYSFNEAENYIIEEIKRDKRNAERQKDMKIKRVSKVYKV